MLLSRLHSLGRNRPNLRVEVDLGRRGEKSLAGSNRAQDCELQSPRRDRILGAQPRHEGRRVVIGQGGMMLFDGFPTRRMKLDMVTPSRDVGLVVRNGALRPCDLDHALHTAPQPGGGLMLPIVPQRPQDAQNVSRGHIRHRTRPQRLGERLEAVRPLRAMLGI